MVKTRQDTWSEKEDLLLAETILRFIREGKTQLEAFEEVSEKLNRTTAACGFRWNSVVRKYYKNEIEEAKRYRRDKKIKKGAITSVSIMKKSKPKKEEINISFPDVLNYLQELYEKSEQRNENEEVVKDYKERIRSLEEKLSLSQEANRQLQEELDQVKKEKEELESIVGHVRKVIVNK